MGTNLNFLNELSSWIYQDEFLREKGSLINCPFGHLEKFSSQEIPQNWYLWDKIKRYNRLVINISREIINYQTKKNVNNVYS